MFTFVLQSDETPRQMLSTLLTNYKCPCARIKVTHVFHTCVFALLFFARAANHNRQSSVAWDSYVVHAGVPRYTALVRPSIAYHRSIDLSSFANNLISFAKAFFPELQEPRTMNSKLKHTCKMSRGQTYAFEL